MLRPDVGANAECRKPQPVSVAHGARLIRRAGRADADDSIQNDGRTYDKHDDLSDRKVSCQLIHLQVFNPPVVMIVKYSAHLF